MEEDPFEQICRPFIHNINMGGVITKMRDDVPFDFQNPDLRWQICCALEFLSKHAWIPLYKRRQWHSLGLVYQVEDYAVTNKLGNKISHGAMIIACRLAQIRETHQRSTYTTNFKMSLDYDIIPPYTDKEVRWKIKPAREYASMALTCSLDFHLIDNLIAIIAQYANIPFLPPPAYRTHARNIHRQLKEFAPHTQNT